MHRIMNFNPGPAALPLPALELARDELLDFHGTGMSIIEHSHRDKSYEGVHFQAIELLRTLLQIPEAYDVLLLQGGASQQFALVPMNFLPPGGCAGYVATGSWSDKAVGEARSVAALFGGEIQIAAKSVRETTGAETSVRMPESAEISVDPQAAFLHVTSNETIDGLQFPTDPNGSFPMFPNTVPLAADMSSDLLSRKLNVGQFALIYAGAQKNIGPSGLVVVIVRRDFLAGGRADIPAIFRYGVHSDNRSLYNTPPTFAVYLLRNTLQWIDDQGGLPAIEARNQQKAALLYDTIDTHAGFYRCPAQVSSRSLMNVVFRLPSEELEQRFLAGAEGRGMIGLKGHRSVGGIRVSCYNAVAPEWVQALATYMVEFVADSAKE